MILLDKSSFQALSRDEIGFLAKHYSLVIPPILIIEIAADLSKRVAGDTSLSKGQVVMLSKKLLECQSPINIDHRLACEHNLLGQAVLMDGRPLVGNARRVKAKDGTWGIFIDEDPLWKDIRRWSNSDFTQDEHTTAENWRDLTRGLDLEGLRNRFVPSLLKVKDFMSLRQLGQLFDIRLEEKDPSLEMGLIETALMLVRANQETRNSVFQKWHDRGLPSVKQFSPYAHYCARTLMLFTGALGCDSITPKRTNYVDLFYLYYLPFCMVFSSRDAFQSEFSKHLMRDDQTFIHGDELKRDLRAIADDWDALADQQKEERAYDFGSYPPLNPESPTHQVWQKYMRPWEPGSGNRAIRMTPEQREKLLNHIKPMMDAIDQLKQDKQ